ncbi:hypothetical protein PVAND_010847 [Polypedilum vanderplanki]|uniref:Methyltransferase-like protein 23 n=1 Tax=Polypedilum vanderplanki TaxID=319348 RepID=A0A9J6CGU3_POLVA|nr:hypothetical protein PVAND_010847 [Polypedilum vanderplanki]
MNQNNADESDKSAEIVKKFNFISKDCSVEVEVNVLEVLAGVYSYYTWPSAKILAYFLFYSRRCIVNKKILEIGSGTSLPGILAKKLGAVVTLSDSALLNKSLTHIKKICAYNNLKVGTDIQVIGLTWGMFGNMYDLGNDFDLIIGSDVLFDCYVFEEVLSTVAFLLERNPKSTFICSYQVRSSDWSFENLLKKWNLKCRNIDLNSIGKELGIDLKDLMEGHVIYLLEFYRIQ